MGARRLSAVPDSPPRAIGYVRVSKERDEGISPELQLAAITDHCARAGYRLTEVITDLDMTGRFWRRRQAEKAVAMVEAGDADVIVLWKWSRLARNRRDWAIAVDRVEVAGGRLESATEPVDVTTSSGRLARGMLAEFAAFESERIGDVWREVHARRTSRGLPANGKPRFGYRVVDGIHRPDPVTGPVLAGLYRRYIAGESMYTLAAWLNREQIPTVAGYSSRGPGAWSQNSLRGMLDRGFGAGLITVHGAAQRGAHEPVIDEATWNAYLAARDARRTLRRSERSPYLLSGLVWCRCGRKMGGSRYGATKHFGMVCLSAKDPGGARHPHSLVRMDRVEDEVLAWLRELAAEIDAGTDTALAQRARSSRRRQDAAVLRRELVSAETALTRLAMQRASERDLPTSIFAAARDELLAQRTVLEERIRAAEADANAGEPAKIAGDLLGRWDRTPLEHRRAALRQLVRRVTVADARSASLQVEITPTFER